MDKLKFLKFKERALQKPYVTPYELLQKDTT